jgi:hypothetical protein
MVLYTTPPRGKDMDDRERWDARYREGVKTQEPNARLRKYRPRLKPGLAMDLASGLGQNAELLVAWTTVHVDISEEALRGANGLRVVAASPLLPFGPRTFDTIICTYFLDLQVDFAFYLKPGGTLFYETYTSNDAKYRPDFPAKYRFGPSQIPILFKGLTTLAWEETDDGTRVRGTWLGFKPLD